MPDKLKTIFVYDINNKHYEILCDDWGFDSNPERLKICLKGCLVAVFLTDKIIGYTVSR